jgi:hypothetical protein
VDLKRIVCAHGRLLILDARTTTLVHLDFVCV